jgi:hypothetical protein
MKIDFVLTAGNINSHYTKLYPLIYKIWKERFNLDCYLILVADEIPDYLEELKNYIILWNPIENINNIYVAQVIRILYPALFKKKNILVTDLDIFPVSRKYFIDSIKDVDDNKFISYTDRYFKQKMVAICYNVAKSEVWSDIFGINTEDDIRKFLIENYNNEYNGRKNCSGWYTDQLKLYEYLNNWKKKENHLILKDKDLNFKRLNNRQVNKEYIVKKFKKVLDELELYSDIHAIKPYSKTGYYLRKITEKLTQ